MHGKGDTNVSHLKHKEMVNFIQKRNNSNYTDLTGFTYQTGKTPTV